MKLARLLTASKHRLQIVRELPNLQIAALCIGLILAVAGIGAKTVGHHQPQDTGLVTHGTSATKPSTSHQVKGATTTPVADTETTSGAAANGTNTSSTTSGATSGPQTQSSPSGTTLPAAKLATIAPLVVSPGAVTVGTNAFTGYNCPGFTVSLGNGKRLLPPRASYADAVVASQPYPNSNDDRYRTSWDMDVCRSRPTAQGQLSLTITATGEDGSVHTGTLSVTVLPAPNFGTSQGPLTTSDDGTNITYTSNFTIVPSANFGNPTIQMAMGSDLGCIGGTQGRTIQYSGQNNYWLSCVISKMELNANKNSGFFIHVYLTSDSVDGGGDLLYTVSIPASGV